MWQHSAPSNLIVQTPHLNHSLGKDSLSDPPEPLVEETLEFQEEYPQEVAEEAEEEVEEVVEEATQEYLQQQHHNKGYTTPVIN